MLKFKSTRGTRAGFTLIELAIVLAITALLTAGLWRMMSSGNTQLRDQAAADQQRDLIKAVQGYLASPDGATQLATLASGFVISLDCLAPHASFCNFRPTGMSAASTNSYNQQYEIRVIKDTAAGVAPNIYSFMIKTFGGDTIPDTSGGRIASMIGADGGFVYQADVCGVIWACGAFNSWSVNPAVAAPAGYGFINTAFGQIASRTSVGTNASLNSPWLARVNVPGDTAVANGIDDYNTIQTDTSLGGRNFFGIGDGLSASPGGQLVDFRRLTIRRLSDTAANRQGASLLNINSGCAHTELRFYDPADAAYDCSNAVDITGGVSITGLLKAHSLYAGTFIYETSSDRRIKTDIQAISNALDKVAKLNGYSFFIEGEKGKRYGVIAQDVEQQFPELVHDSSAGNHKTVDYMGLIGPLVAAVKELKEQNEALRSELDALKKKGAP